MIRVGQEPYAKIADIMSVYNYKLVLSDRVQGIEIDYIEDVDNSKFIIPFSYYDCANQLYEGIMYKNNRLPQLYMNGV